MDHDAFFILINVPNSMVELSIMLLFNPVHGNNDKNDNTHTHGYSRCIKTQHPNGSNLGM
jgi:hypothetical protein